MTRRFSDFEDLELFDPMCMHRRSPVTDEEAELLEALCLTAMPGPLAVDDAAEGDNAVVAILPDGRVIVSLSAPVEQTEDPDAVRANAELICKARHMLLRLLRERRGWARQREELLSKVRDLEAALEAAIATEQPSSAASARHRPR